MIVAVRDWVASEKSGLENGVLRLMNLVMGCAYGMLIVMGGERGHRIEKCVVWFEHV